MPRKRPRTHPSSSRSVLLLACLSRLRETASHFSSPLRFLCSRHLPFLTYCHQPPQHLPTPRPHIAGGGRCSAQRGFAFQSEAHQSVVAESCSLSLRSVRFFWLLPTPPRGDAVTSSSQPGYGPDRLESPTPEGCGASQRTTAKLHFASAANAGARQAGRSATSRSVSATAHGFVAVSSSTFRPAACARGAWRRSQVRKRRALSETAAADGAAAERQPVPQRWQSPAPGTAR